MVGNVVAYALFLYFPPPSYCEFCVLVLIGVSKGVVSFDDEAKVIFPVGMITDIVDVAGGAKYQMGSAKAILGKVIVTIT